MSILGTMGKVIRIALIRGGCTLVVLVLCVSRIGGTAEAAEVMESTFDRYLITVITQTPQGDPASEGEVLYLDAGGGRLRDCMAGARVRRSSGERKRHDGAAVPGEGRLQAEGYRCPAAYRGEDRRTARTSRKEQEGRKCIMLQRHVLPVRVIFGMGEQAKETKRKEKKK